MAGHTGIFYRVYYMRVATIFILMLIGIISCQNLSELDYSDFGSESLLINATPISAVSQRLLEGVYIVSTGSEQIGDNCILKWSNSGLSIYGAKNINLFLMKGGISNSKIIFEGYWRDFNNFRAGKSRLFINENDGAGDIIHGEMPKTIEINGFYDENGTNSKSITLKFERRIENTKPFYIIAHRGGGRNSDNLPASENSVELIQLSEALGANAIEIDVRLTKDNIPILFHDDFLSSRLINGDFLTGSIENYYYEHLKKFCKLKHNEEIPTLQQALEAVINKTGLSLVWLDIKSSKALDVVVPIVASYQTLANSLNRNVKILVGISDEATKQQFIRSGYPKLASSICEISTEAVKETSSEFWGPAWTLGTQKDKTQAMHSLGVKVLVWTIDDSKYMEKFLNDGDFDGFVTNYPSILAYKYYIRK